MSIYCLKKICIHNSACCSHFNEHKEMPICKLEDILINDEVECDSFKAEPLQKKKKSRMLRLFSFWRLTLNLIQMHPILRQGGAFRSICLLDVSYTNPSTTFFLQNHLPFYQFWRHSGFRVKLFFCWTCRSS